MSVIPVICSLMVALRPE